LWARKGYSLFGLLVTDEDKGLIKLTIDVNVIKLFYSLLKLWQNKQEPLSLGSYSSLVKYFKYLRKGAYFSLFGLLVTDKDKSYITMTTSINVKKIFVADAEEK
jgi:hypothetical protein